MSETKHLTGKLNPVELINDSMEDTALELLQECNIDRDSYCYPTALEQLRDEGWSNNTFYITKDKIYRLEYEDHDPCDDIFKAEATGGGVISFEVKFYNGACGLHEAIDNALDKPLPTT